MSAPHHPPRFTAGAARASDTDPGMRISDSERAEVADRLSKHFQDGRLDQAEFNARLDKTMKAKTRADLNGLFDDLPGDQPTAVPPGQDGAEQHTAQHKTRCARLGFLALVVVAVAVVAQALAHSFIPWLVIGIVAFLWLRDR